MKIALYSETARQPVLMARNLIKAHRIECSSHGIRQCRQAIFALEEDDPVKTLLQWNDFYTLSMCRDLLFHSTEHRFSLAQIEAACNSLNLRFLGFAADSPDALELFRSYEASFPDDPTRTCLENWQIYEQQYPSSFIGMYTFWLQKPPVADSF